MNVQPNGSLIVRGGRCRDCCGSSISLTALADQLSDRDKAILTDLERTRVLTGAQLQRLHSDPINDDSRARDRRRVLQRFTDLDLVSTLDRRIGGIRAGSACIRDTQ